MSPEPIGVAGNAAEADDRGVAAPRFRLPPATRIGVVRLHLRTIGCNEMAHFLRFMRHLHDDLGGALSY